MGNFLLVLGLLLASGYAFSALFARTRIPDAIPLMLVGILLGPILHLVDTAALIKAMPYFGMLALILILFEGGLELALDQVGRQALQALLLVGLSFALSMLLCVAVLHSVMGVSTQAAVVLATALSATSAPIVVPVLSRLVPGTRVEALLGLESSLADALAVVLAGMLLHTGGASEFLAVEIASGVGRAIALGAVAGVLAGVVWLWLLAAVAREGSHFVLTLACVLGLVGFVEMIEGSGAIAILFFGLAMANGRSIVRLLPTGWQHRIRSLFPHGEISMEERIPEFLRELTQIVRTFFFVYLGLVMSWPGLNALFWVGALLLVVAVPFSRVIATTLFRIASPLTPPDRALVLAMVPRGLATAVLASFASQQYAYPVDPLALALVIIFATNVFMAVGVKRWATGHTA